MVVLASPGGFLPEESLAAVGAGLQTSCCAARLSAAARRSARPLIASQELEINDAPPDGLSAAG